MSSANLSHSYKPIILCILDGWGIASAKDAAHNAIAQAHTPNLDYLQANFPMTTLVTSGLEVGLPEGQMGNSEVGHMTIGGGRVILQDLVRINAAMQSDQLKNQPILQNLAAHYQHDQRHSVHLLGLCSDGGVHAHLEHLLYLANFLGEHDILIKLHLFLDGRDVAPQSAAKYLTQIEQLCQRQQNVQIATICGRFYAMDRDNRLDRTKLCLDAILNAQGVIIDNWQAYLASQYQLGNNDEFIIPSVMQGYSGMLPGDSCLWLNFRSDRVRQLVQLLLVDAPQLVFKISMTNYSSELSKSLLALFPEQAIHNNLGEILSQQHKTQLRLAETEKYAHVTFFFNGGAEQAYPGEERIMIPSPLVQTYDLQPAMSSVQLTDTLIEAIKLQKYDLIIVNYANADMVGHSGFLQPAIKAAEAIDQALGRIYQAIKNTQAVLLITADHGNIECMFDQEAQAPHTSHTCNPVPLMLIAEDLYQAKIKLSPGNLSDLAPTILKMMQIKQPKEMTGRALYT